ncbi:hypothetical protein L2750_07675 [Shewanella submarina]|uniref:RHS repeat-associated core domain-containing protein n=1 Tax=Shewanella submarina TaxID=2016376 RepID=A0ABV7GAS5_9GAMM|nr:RHS repeat-associated core domain-containing protein [Shewanella submarina]MCL1037030.1 hypothetical protein [Shewanella submarina]
MVCSNTFTTNADKYHVIRSTSSASATSFSSTGSLSVSWGSVSGVSGYEVQQSKNGSSWSTIYTGTATSTSRSGLGSGQYRYRVRTKLGSYSGSYVYSNYASVLHSPSSISVPTSTVTNGSIGISWAAVSTASSYTLQESANSGSWTTLTSTSSRSYTRSGRINGSYKYRVRACNSSGCSGWRYSRNVTVLLPPPVPASISVPTSTDTNGAYSVSWSSTSTATSYTLAERINGGSWSYTTISGASKSYSGRGNASYQYAVRGCNSSGCGGWRYSSTFSVLLPPPVPTSISVPTSTDTNGAYSVSWSSTSTATSYTLAERINSGSWSYTTISGTSKSYSGRGNGSYQYAVRGCNSSGCGGWRYSTTFSVLLPPPVPGSISVPTSTVTNGSIGISWAASSTATSYTLQESVNGGSWSTLTSTSGRSYTRSGRANGSYKYQIRACNASGCSGWRVSGSVTVLLPPPVPSSISVPTSTVTNGSIGISWAASSTATSYTLQESVNGGGWSTLTSTSGRSYTRSGRANGSYKYQIRACNASGCSGWRVSGSVTVLLPPSVPGSISVPTSTVTNGSIGISWAASSTATNYTLQESVNGGSWSTLTSTSGRSYTRTSRTNGSYKYQVRACNASGCSGWRVSSSVTVFLPPPVPASISVPTSTVTNGSIAVSWSASSSATSYTLQESVNGGGWSTLTSTSSRSYTRSGRANGSYKYQIRACNASGCSGWRQSAAVSVQLMPPADTTSHTLGQEDALGSRLLSWPAVANSSYYRVTVRSSDGTEQVYTTSDTSFILSLGMGSYTVSVQSCNFADMCSAGYNVGSYSPTTAVRFQHTDMLGSVIAESDSSGTMTSRSHYEPFGKRMGGDKAGIGYTGHLQDEDLGLTYMQARYYDPLIGRFYADDPLAFRDVHSFNRYAYANNNPYKYVDPDGRASELSSELAGISKSMSPNQRAVVAGVGIGILAAPIAASVMGDMTLAETGVLAADTLAGDAMGGASLGAGGVTLYRVVSNGELADIVKTGVMRLQEGGMEVKEFVTNLPDAKALQGALQKLFGDADSIVKVDAPASVMEVAEKIRVSDIPGGVEGAAIRGNEALSKITNIEEVK